MEVTYESATFGCTDLVGINITTEYCQVMRISEIIQATQSLTEAPFYAELQGRDGLPCRVWKNPNKREFASAINRGVTAGLRGLLTGADLYVWQSVNLLHTDFERDAAVSGVRVALRAGEIQVNDETVDQPEHFPWIFPQAVNDMDIEDRRAIVATWLLSNARLKRVYPPGFKVTWYS